MIFSLDPINVWEQFANLSSIPRASKNEEAIRLYLFDFAKKYSLLAQQDATGNVLITKKTSQLDSQRPTIALQSHMDMVCEKEATKQQCPHIPSVRGSTGLGLCCCAAHTVFLKTTHLFPPSLRCSGTCDIDLVLAVAPEFGLRTQHAREIVVEVARATATWREVAHQVGAPARELDYLESAFEHDDLEKALTL